MWCLNITFYLATPFISICTLYFILFFVAPAGFPQNLAAQTLNSTAITVSWDEVLVNETNGIITQYNVTAIPDESFANVVEMLVNNLTFSVVFDGLEEFVVYRFTISARTVVGFGPTSPEVSARTNEAGKHYCTLYAVHVSLKMNAIHTYTYIAAQDIHVHVHTCIHPVHMFLFLFLENC